jgi:hypothetical protein
LGYRQQIETYLIDLIHRNSHPDTDLDANLYVSTVEGSQMVTNISINAEDVICNSRDVKILWKTNYFGTRDESIDPYIEKAQSYGDIYVYNVHIPEYLDSDDINKYNYDKKRQFGEGYDMKTLVSCGLESVQKFISQLLIKK